MDKIVWLPVRDLVNLRSGDAGHKVVTDDYGNRVLVPGRVGDVMEQKASDYGYEKLKESIREKGFDPNMPIYLDKIGPDAILCNGHHRLTAAYELGLPEVPVTTDTHAGWYGVDGNQYT